MKKHVAALASIAAFLAFGPAQANAGEELPTEDVGRNLVEPRPDPQRREIYCEQVGSGLWDCEEEVCSDWSHLQSSCWIVAYRRDGNP